MKVTLARAASTSQGTFGILSIDGAPVCVTCELPWENNDAEVSCVPPGTYPCIRHVSQKFPLGNTWEVTGVPGRVGILIHNANDISELEGCIAVGNSFGKLNGLPAVLGSVSTLAMLNNELPDDFDLTISQSTAAATTPTPDDSATHNID
jgi:hypothetical protein